MYKNLPNKYKLTPEKYKEIKEIVKNLPVCQRRDNKGELMFRTISRVVKGSELKEETIDGKPVDKNANYHQLIKEPVMVNHEVNLVEIWQKDGKTGCDYYIKFFQDLEEEEKKNRKPVVINGYGQDFGTRKDTTGTLPGILKNLFPHSPGNA